MFVSCNEGERTGKVIFTLYMLLHVEALYLLNSLVHEC